MKDIPLCINISNDTITPTVWENADYLLFDMMYNVHISGRFHYGVKTSSILTHCIFNKLNNCTLFYVHKDVHLSSLGNDMYYRLSRIQYGPTLVPYGPISDEQAVTYLFYNTRHSMTRPERIDLKTLPILNSWFSGTAEPPRLKVSARHITHMTIHEIRELGVEYFSKVHYIFPFLEHLARIGMHEAMFVGILTWAQLLPEQQHEISKVAGIWDWVFKDLDDFMKTIKNKFSLRLKAIQNTIPVDLTPFFELEVLVNRGIGDVDWAAEQEHRTNPNVANISGEEVRKCANFLFKKLK